ncbi:hypothetical protein OB2597_15285 [Pseudooceanicola batsensis HTCC2597]|uniref:Acetolactate synthase n=1 Tax=Pseudooceanicola batsensis (strain ATCC BAA-863 / DSM 15984 / KCTC 12145 / HTCC2597) TaxID=252305 RepID=A3TYT9_PSEBH|nr:DUF6497 family protein [Pseudooceanicola batsensis]EAQ02757.1 hypothetical protein OB2597_15285 [Pseudooceanicola batsensis HTCC2597]
MKGATTFVAATGALIAAATTAWGQEEAPAVPSGFVLVRQEVLEETQPDGTLWIRLRYVSPGITRDDYASVTGDFEALCRTDALAYEPATPAPAAQAVISISSSPVSFGTAAPEVTQFFEVFSLEDGDCIWEAF